MPDCAHLVDKGLAHVAETDHDVEGLAQIDDCPAAQIRALKNDVGTGDGQQDGHQQHHGDHREEAAGPRFPLLLHLCERIHCVVLQAQGIRRLIEY